MSWHFILFAVIFLLHFPLYIYQSNVHALGWFGNLAQGLAILMGAIQFGRLSLGKKVLPEQLLIFLGLVIWLMAHSLLAYSELLLGVPATGTVTDAIWLIGYILLLRALHILLKNTYGRAMSSHVTIVACVVPIVIAVLYPLLREPERTLLTKTIQVIFPVMDLWIAAVAFRVASQERMRLWWIAGFGSLIVGISDLIFPYHDTLAEPVFRYLDIPLFVGYSSWWILGTTLVRLANSAPRTQSML